MALKKNADVVVVAKRKHDKQQQKETKVAAVATYNLADIGLAIFFVN